MQPTESLIDALYVDKIAQARATSVEQKLLVGPRLFDKVCRIMRDGIRHQHPDLSEERVQAMLLERLAIARRLEETP